MSLAFEGLQGPSQGAFTRIGLAADRPVEVRGPDDLVLGTSIGEVVLCCPLTGVGLTRAMADAVGLDSEALVAMVERRAPLGVRAHDWVAVLDAARSAIDARDGNGVRLADGRVSAAIGGSSVACFSSAQTALEKKRFPQDEADLVAQVRASPLNQDRPEEEVRRAVTDAMVTYRSLRLGEVVPRAPWFGIMAALGIEGPADVDIQLHSDVVDAVLTEASRVDPSIGHRRRQDRLKRWHPTDVHAAVPALGQLHAALAGAGLPVEIEYLGPGGDRTIAARTDWWHIDVGGQR